MHHKYRYLWRIISFWLLFTVAAPSWAGEAAKDRNYHDLINIPQFRILKCADVHTLTQEECNDLTKFIFFEIERARILINWRYYNGKTDGWKTAVPVLHEYTLAKNYAGLINLPKNKTHSKALKKNDYGSIAECFLYKCKELQIDKSHNYSQIFEDLFLSIECSNISLPSFDQINSKMYFYLISIRYSIDGFSKNKNCSGVPVNQIALSIAELLTHKPGTF